MGYSSHTYPGELAEKIISEWPEVTNPLDDLPPKEALISLLSEAFQASLLREEGRPIRCRLVLTNQSLRTQRGGGTPDGDAGVTAERGKEIERARNSAT